MPGPDPAALLRDERPADPEQPVVLFGCAWDNPLRAIFGAGEQDLYLSADGQADSAEEVALQADFVRGGAAMLHSLHGRHEGAFRAARAAFLRSEPGRIVALLPVDADSEGLGATLERLAAENGLLTVSWAAERIPAGALFDGLYPAPTRVIGVPGVNPYQSRINRYYGLDSPSTIPRPDLVAARRHFGQAAALLDYRLEQAHQARRVFTSIEALPFAERCGLCGQRPAERPARGKLLCTPCAARLDQAQQPRPIQAVIRYRVPAVAAILAGARSPAAYIRALRALRSAVVRACEDCAAAFSSVERLFETTEAGVLAVHPADAVGALVRLEARFTALARDLGTPAPVLTLGLAAGNEGPSQLFADSVKAVGLAVMRPATGRAAICVRAGTAPETVQYTPEALTVLAESCAQVNVLALPDDLFSDLSGQIARGTAPLYYSYARLRLSPVALRTLEVMEGAWGKESPRFFHALNHALALRAIGTTGPASTSSQLPGVTGTRP